MPTHQSQFTMYRSQKFKKSIPDLDQSHCFGLQSQGLEDARWFA